MMNWRGIGRKLFQLLTSPYEDGRVTLARDAVAEGQTRTKWNCLGV
jgi:hypothetical protein